MVVVESGLTRFCAKIVFDPRSPLTVWVSIVELSSAFGFNIEAFAEYLAEGSEDKLAISVLTKLTKFEFGIAVLLSSLLLSLTLEKRELSLPAFFSIFLLEIVACATLLRSGKLNIATIKEIVKLDLSINWRSNLVTRLCSKDEVFL